jgi:hypothetical protein
VIDKGKSYKKNDHRSPAIIVMYLDHEEMSFDRLALLDDPAHEVLDLGADSKFGSGQGSGKQEIETICS